jgi:hypothetical protein
MPSINVPDLNNKEMWRTTRLLLWSLIAAVAFLDFFNLITIPEYFGGFTLLVYVVAAWVVFFHALEAMKKRS